MGECQADCGGTADPDTEFCCDGAGNCEEWETGTGDCTSGDSYGTMDACQANCTRTDNGGGGDDVYCCPQGGGSACHVPSAGSCEAGATEFTDEGACDAACMGGGVNGGVGDGYCCSALTGSCSDALPGGQCLPGDSHYTDLAACSQQCSPGNNGGNGGGGGYCCTGGGVDPLACGPVMDQSECAAGYSVTQDDQCNGECEEDRPFCCAADGSCSQAAGADCPAGEQEYASQNACDTNCQAPDPCGNGTVDAGEECDDGQQNSDTAANACRTDCTNAGCGDGVTDNGEECDSGTDNSDVQANACRTDCTNPSCGDAVTDNGEQCDNGAQNSDTAPNACRTDCQNASCGDGVEDNGEECDDGNLIEDDGCSSQCIETRECLRCGDTCQEKVGISILDCDQQTPGVIVECNYVNGVCTHTNQNSCGDGTVDTDEECDNGAQNSDTEADACRTDCTNAECGDGVQDNGEECDDGNTNNDDQCRNDCTNPPPPVSCGNGTLDAGEQCDNGAQNSNTTADACRANCQNPSCGDGVVDTGEECDDGNQTNKDGCNTQCNDDPPECTQDSDCGGPPGACTGPVEHPLTISHGGDNVAIVIQPGQCYRPKRTCSEQVCGNSAEFCDCPVTPVCGNGAREPGEECDDGNLVSGDGCTAQCENEVLQCGPGRGINDGCPIPVDPQCAGPRNRDIEITHTGDGSVSIVRAGECWLPTITCINNTCGDAIELCTCPVRSSTSSVASSAASSDASDSSETNCSPDQVGKWGGQCGVHTCNDAQRCMESCTCQFTDAFCGACNICLTDDDCTDKQLCFDGMCSQYELDTVWVDAGAPDEFDATVGHSVVSFPVGGTMKMWDVHQSWELSLIRSNVASAEGISWERQNTLMSGNPVLGEFSHVTFAGKQWLIGGTDFRQAPKRSRHVWYSADGVSWERNEDALPTFVDQHASVVHAGKMWILGGVHAGDDVSDLVLASHDGKTWTQVGSLPEPRTHATAVTYNGGIVLLGGHDSSGQPTSTVWRSTDGVSWESIGTLPVPLAQRSAAVFAKRIWFVGNAENSEPVTFYSEDGGTTWQPFAKPDTEMANGTDLVYWNGALFVIGGYGDDQTVLNEVHYLTALPTGSCDDDGLCASSASSEGNTSQSSRRFSDPPDDDDDDGNTGGETGSDDDDDNVPARYECGNGRREGAEECDDGNRFNGDGCNANCFFEQRPPDTPPPSVEPERYTAECGNGVKDTNEECDDGNRVARDGCSPTCTYELNIIPSQKGCGNGIVEAGEECDDGNSIEKDGCSATCTVEFTLLTRDKECGNGLREQGEVCDHGRGNSDTLPDACRSDCTEARCGDGIVDTGEFCDNGAGNSDSEPDRCRQDCTVHRCGDGTRDRREECDDGNIINGDGCSSICTEEQSLFLAATVCGDGILAETEECDDSNKRDGDGCSSVCLLEIGICGDGIIQSLLGEVCEEALHDPELPFECRNCKFFSATCGDGTIDPGEQCDDGESNSNAPGGECRSTCELAHCGDTIVDPEEECDDGNRVNGDSCSWICKTERLDIAIADAETEVESDQQQIPGAQVSQFPNLPNYQALPQQLPIAHLQPLIAVQGPAGDTGPAAVAIIGAGAAAGIGWVRRRRK